MEMVKYGPVDLWENINNGYFTILCFGNGAHWALVDNEKSIANQAIYVDESGAEYKDKYKLGNGPRLLSDLSWGESSEGYTYYCWASTLKCNEDNYILTWDKYLAASYYKIKGTNEGNQIEEKISNKEMFDLKKLGGGYYSLHIEAYNDNDVLLESSKEIQIEVKIVNFKDPKFETWMVSRYDKNKDGKIQISEIPSELEFDEQDMFNEFDFDDCSILYPENIDCIESVRITRCGNVKASQFKGMKKISSITSFSIGGYVLGVNNIEELLSYFPNVKVLNIGGEYHPGSGGSSELIKNCDFLDKMNGLTSLGICYIPSEEDLEHIIRHKDSLTNLSIDGTFRDSSIFDRTLDYTKLENLKNLKDLTIIDVNKIKDGLFINKLDKLENLYLNCGFNESFNLSNQNVKKLRLGVGVKECDSMENITFGNLPNVEELEIASSLYNYGPVSYAELNSKHIENIENLKSLSISGYKMDDLSFLSKLTNLEGIFLQEVKLESTSSLPNMDNFNKLRFLVYTNGNIADISKIEGLVRKKTFKELCLENQENLNPNTRDNQRIFDILEDRKKDGENVIFRATNYILKNYISDDVETVKIDEIIALRIEQLRKIQDLITVERFPISETYDVKVVSRDGEEKNENEVIGSKDKIQIINTLGEILQEYTVIIPGDVTGNGEVKLYDAFKILNDSVKKVAIDELDVKIRDYNEDEKVTTYDALQYMKETMKEE